MCIHRVTLGQIKVMEEKCNVSKLSEGSELKTWSSSDRNQQLKKKVFLTISILLNYSELLAIYKGKSSV